MSCTTMSIIEALYLLLEAEANSFEQYPVAWAHAFVSLALDVDTK